MTFSYQTPPRISHNRLGQARLELAPVPETGFSYRLTAYKSMGHFFGLSYLNISGNNQFKNIFFRISSILVTCPHAQLRGRTVNKKLWTFFGPWGRARSQSPPCCIFRVKQIHQSTASERTTRLHVNPLSRRRPPPIRPESEEDGNPRTLMPTTVDKLSFFEHVYNQFLE